MAKPKAKASTLTALNTPEPIPVQTRPQAQGDRPLAVEVKGRWQRIVGIHDVWRVVDEWWTEREINRHYFLVDLESGGRLTIYQDQVDGQWYRQRGEAR
jgi:hypothetical protein